MQRIPKADRASPSTASVVSSLLALVLLISTGVGQESGSPQTPVAELKRPVYVPQDRSEEDWSALEDSRFRRTDLWDPIKFIPLRNDTSWYLTLAGELRAFYESYRNYNWGVGPQDNNGYYLNRLIGSADVHFGKQVRVFFEAKSGLEFGRNGGPRPVQDEDKLDLHQLFLELRPYVRGDQPPVSIKIGRQQLRYGDGGLVDIRDLNVRRSFDGVKLTFRPKQWQVDMFAVKPVLSNPGYFDDYPDSAQTFWGVYAITTKRLPSFLQQLDVYYLGLDRKNARFDQGTAREQRHTVGALVHFKRKNFFGFAEGVVQFGKFGQGDLLAWKFAPKFAYTFAKVRFRPTVSLLAAISSGDKNLSDPSLQTFNPLFPRGLYYGVIDDSGSLNGIVVHPQLSLQLTKTLTLTPEAFFFWRQQASDGIYSAPGTLLRSGRNTQSKYVGALQEFALTWEVDRHAAIQLLGAYYEAGPFLRETQPPGRNIAYLSAKIIYRF